MKLSYYTASRFQFDRHITLGTLGDPGKFDRIDAGCFGKPRLPPAYSVDSG